MKTYTGTKTIKAIPTTRKEYCEYRGWELPEDENGDEEIYLVEYPVDPESKPNHENHEGYISMSPKHVFDKAYRPSGDFLERMKIEKEDLSVKVSSLNAALKENKVPKTEVGILQEQLKAMKEYLRVLTKRVENHSK